MHDVSNTTWGMSEVKSGEMSGNFTSAGECGHDVITSITR